MGSVRWVTGQERMLNAAIAAFVTKLSASTARTPSNLAPSPPSRATDARAWSNCLPAQNLPDPVINLLAGFAFEPDCLAGF